MVQTYSNTPRGSNAIPLPDFTNENVHLSNGYTYHDSLTSLIGLGSFGVVYKGYNEDDNNKVSENYYHDQVHANGTRQVAQLEFPKACPFQVAIKKMSRVHVKENELKVIRLLIDNIARGYKDLFDLKIVHRDIKPQNILIKYVGKSKQLSSAKITDFGIARTLDTEESDLCNVAGTLFYMAPEVGANLLKTCQYDSKVDMWSIGCLLYQCVTGEIPFDECCLCKLFLYTAGANYDAYDPPALPETTNEEIGEIIHSLLEIDSSRRCTPVQFYIKATSFSQRIG
ncbi:unnamed protein product [Strongylus vulgaris]|uniref:Protein kinase domain-containing protein n=1 Tax=Strongylus vulgaris TaxID=40348 RepID=A0A3P7IT93_STRVU|nr:unnamed protein product [Strongylus vulgaris]